MFFHDGGYLKAAEAKLVRNDLGIDVIRFVQVDIGFLELVNEL